MSLLLVSYIPILCHFGHLNSQPIISPLASFVPKAQPNQAVFLVLGLPSQDHFC